MDQASGARVVDSGMRDGVEAKRVEEAVSRAAVGIGIARLVAIHTAGRVRLGVARGGAERARGAG